MIVGFTGTQLGQTLEQHNTLKALLTPIARDFVSMFHSGDCVGADEQAHKVAKGLNFITVGHPPLYDGKRAHCKYDIEREPKAYMERNDEIVRECEWLIAAPKGFEEELRSGTWATIRRARKAGKKVTIIWPDGTLDQ